MNIFQLREYWVSQYEDIFGVSYKTEKINIEYFLLKRLLSIFNYYLILEATDQFFKSVNKEKASLLLFGSKKYFDNTFKKLIKEKEIVQYHRMIPWYSLENQEIVRKKVQRYYNYLYAISLSQDEVDDMNNIIEELKKIPLEEL